MKKIITKILALMILPVLCWQLEAQVIEGFESGIPAGWTTYETETDDPGFVITTAQAHTGNQSLYHNDDNIADISTSWVVTDVNTITADVNDYLAFWYRQYFTASYYEYSGLYISTASGDPIANPDDFVELQEFNAAFGYSENEWTEYTLALTSYVGEDVYFAFRYDGDFSTEFFIDDFSLQPIPSCFKPKSITVDNITANTADVNWLAGESETEWEIIYGEVGFDPETEGETVTVSGTPSETLTDLDAETDYEFYVIAICGPDDESVLVGPSSFTTLISCPAPTALTVGDVTVSSVEASWTAGGSETEWVIIYGTPGFDPETEGESIEDTDGTPGETIPSLASGAEYEIYVKAVCGPDDESSLLGPVLFNTNALVDCSVGPVNTNFCYGNGQTTEYVYVSNDGTTLNLAVIQGEVENTWDEFIVLDSDGTELYNGYGNGGDLSGLVFQSTGDQITIQVVADGGGSCQTNPYTPIDIRVACATCINPEATYTVVEDCESGPQFKIDVDITSLGDATDVDISDNQGSAVQTADATGVYTFGPYVNGTNVQITVENNQDLNCSITSTELTQEYCSQNYLDCGLDDPINTVFCYESYETVELTYTSNDGSVLNLDVNSGSIYTFGGTFDVIDSDGEVIYTGYGNSGDLSGLNFQSTGDEITVIYTAGFEDCEGFASSSIDLTVECSSCVNPQATFSVAPNCIVGPEFNVEVDLTSLGDATDVDISDNQGSAVQTADAPGVFTFGPYANGTNVEIAIENNQDESCVISSSELTQEYCSENYLDCGLDDPINTVFCYDSDEVVELTYTSNDGSVLNLDVNSGTIYIFGGTFDVIDSDGEVLYSGYGDNGDLSGLGFQSSGDEITVIYTAGFYDCEGFSSSSIDLTVECSSCVNPSATYDVVSNCDTGAEEFFVDVDISDLGSASSLTLSDNQESATETATATGIVTFGPYDNNTDVQITIENEDGSCVIASQTLTQIACPPENDLCVDALPAVINTDQFCVDTTPVVMTAANASSTPVSCEGPVVQDVWYEFTAIAPDHMITLIDSPLFDVAHAIYEGDCDNLTEIYCSGEFDNGGTSPGIVATGLTVGETYYIRIFSSVTVTAEFELCITSPDYELDNTTCEEVAPFCAPFDNDGNPEPLIFANGYYYLDEYTAEEGPDYGCLFSQPNPAWFYLKINDTGDLQFEIIQSTAFDGDGNPIGEQLDVDFIVYGPFSELEGNCDDLTDANSVDCSYSGAAVEQMTLADAQAGDIYLVLITNYNQSPGYISLLQTNYGESGGGTTDCTILEDTIYACEGTEVTLTSTYSESIAFVWYENCDENFENCTAISDASGSSLQVSESGYYTVQTYNNEGGINEPIESFRVLFKPSPELDMDEIQSLCGVTSLDLDATPINATEFGTLTYTWYLDGVEISGETTSTLNVTEAGEYTVDVSGTLLDENGTDLVDQFCDVQGVVEVTNAEFSVDLGDNQALCDTASYMAEATVDGEDATDATYTWYDNSGDVIADATASTYEITTTGNYTVEVEIQGCVSEDQIEVVFSDSPEVDLGDDEIVICDGSDAVVTATVFNSADFDTVNFEWLDSSGVEVPGAGNNDTASLAPGDTYTVNVTGVFSFNGSTYSCETSEEIFIIDTAFTVDLGGDQSYCDDSMQDLTAVITGASSDDATYAWYYNGAEITGETGETISVNEDGNYQVEVNINGCTETQNVNLLFDLRPQVDLGEDASVCDLSPIMLDATPSNMDPSEVTFEWSYEGSVVATSATLDPSSHGFGTYEVTVVSLDDPSMTCATIDDITLSLTELNVSVAAAEGSSAIVDVRYCEEDGVPTQEIVLNADVNGEGIDASGITYIWYMNGVEISGETGSSYTAVYDEADEYSDEYSVEAYYGASCSGSATISTEVVIEPYGSGCTITQGISPNADGMNDCLDLTFLSERSGIASLKVYNRYGRLIFESSNYVDSFCGQNEDGDELVTGTYFYVLEMEREDPVFGNSTKGWIYVNQVE